MSMARVRKIQMNESECRRPARIIPNFLPPDIPAPQDDGAARHLTGAKLPDLALPATSARRSICRSLPAARWSMSIRAPACRASMRRPAGTTSPARAAARRSPAVSAIISASSSGSALRSFTGCRRRTPPTSRRRRARLHLPFAILSDEKLALTKALKLPTFTTSGMTLLEAHGAGASTTARSPRCSIRCSRPTRTPQKVIAWLQTKK